MYFDSCNDMVVKCRMSEDLLQAVEMSFLRTIVDLRFEVYSNNEVNDRMGLEDWGL